MGAILRVHGGEVSGASTMLVSGKKRDQGNSRDQPSDISNQKKSSLKQSMKGKKQLR